MGHGTAWGGRLSCKEEIRRVRFSCVPPIEYVQVSIMAITPDCGSGYERSIRPLGPNLYTGLAQQVRAPSLQVGGHRFNSYNPYQRGRTASVTIVVLSSGIGQESLYRGDCAVLCEISSTLEILCIDSRQYLIWMFLTNSTKLKAIRMTTYKTNESAHLLVE